MFGYDKMWLSVVFMTLGCRAKIDIESETEVAIIDVDNDGYDADNDCDDADSSVNPAADEFCDGIDNNCDGQVDEGVDTEYFADLDGDGFGDDQNTVRACQPPAGYIIVGNDCDDNSEVAFPGAPELCDEIDNDCDGETDEFLLEGMYLDMDGDGYGDPSSSIVSCADDLSQYVQNSLDCDDSNAAIHFDAIEVCDEIDNDCDGAIDEPGSGSQIWYGDSDGDGFGDLTVTLSACSMPTGFVENALDCDDSNAEQYPDAPEYCNSQDDDCDGQVDEDPVDPTLFYQDADNDGFGGGNTLLSCLQPVGFVANGMDCDDTTASISPSAPEICNQIDNNCNGVADDNALGAATYYVDADGDGYGNPIQSSQSCSPIAGSVLNALDCDDADPNQNPLGVESCNSEDDNCNGQIDDNAVDADIWYVDLDGDGYGSLSSWMPACTQPAGHVDNIEDCNDGDATHNPDTPEICNGQDDNCNNQIDEGVTLYPWYFDDDGDGFGDPWVVVEACSQPAGMLADNQDCNDLDATINPNADELCNDGIDNNCDGYFDDETSIDAYMGYLDLDGDGYGGGTLESSCDDIYYTQNTDCDDDDPNISPDAIEVCDGIDNDCDGVADSASLCPCNFEQNNGDNYLFCTYNRTWSVAKGECAQIGYHLVTIDDATEDAWLDSRVDAYSTGRWWMGYNDQTVEGYWDWAGPYSSYTNWGPSEPNNANGNEDCGALNQFGAGGLWNDIYCNTSLYFVCEANP